STGSSRSAPWCGERLGRAGIPGFPADELYLGAGFWGSRGSGDCLCTTATPTLNPSPQGGGRRRSLKTEASASLPLWGLFTLGALHPTHRAALGLDPRAGFRSHSTVALALALGSSPRAAQRGGNLTDEPLPSKVTLP